MEESLKKRADVPLGDTWDLTPMYASDAEWEKAFEVTSGYPGLAEAWKGRLSESPEVLLSAVRDIERMRRDLDSIYTYAHLRQDEDLSCSECDARFSRALNRYTEFGTSVSWFRPELLAMDAGLLDSWIESGALEPYGYFLEQILRYRPHTLTDPEERLLSMASEVTGCLGNAFGKLNNVDLPGRLPEVTDEDGTKVKLTNANLIPMLQRGRRTVRKEAFDGFFGEVAGNRATFAALLDGQVRGDWFYARAGRHGSSLDASLFDDQVGTGVYDSLVASVHANLPSIHRYYRLKKRMLGVDSLHMYDVHVPIVQTFSRRFGFEEGVRMTLDAVAPLGDAYVEALSGGFASRWVDRYENVGKRSGAYSSGCYDSWPYILHNYTGTMESVFTLAHEAGHSMHSWLSNGSQPYHLAGYRIILAEVASTTNEMLLAARMMERLDDPGEKAFLVDHLINSFRKTLYRQTMFAEFERLIHERVEGGGSLTTDFLDSSYLGLVRTYHGDAFAFDGEDEAISWEWARIPHMYYNFYVYKYATGLASAVDISRRILSGGSGEAESYLRFLGSGSSRPPLELLRMAGVDLESTDTVDNALAWLGELVTELEGLLE
jgi:oligoendopeptidase F